MNLTNNDLEDLMNQLAYAHRQLMKEDDGFEDFIKSNRDLQRKIENEID